MRSNTFTREELQRLFWQSSIGSIAKQLNVSGFEIRKVCKMYDIPVPVKDYWRMIKENVSPLNTDYIGTDEISMIRKTDKLKNDS